MTPNRQRVYRGEVYFVDFSQTSTGSEINGTHPAVIVQNDIGNYHSGTVIGVVLTSSIKKEGMPTHIILEEPGKPCDGAMAMAEQIFTIDKTRLLGLVDRLSQASMQRIDDAVRVSLAIDKTEVSLMCLCPRCIKSFHALPHHAIRRVDHLQQVKDVCTYCGQGKGYDYWIYDWSEKVKPRQAAEAPAAL